ncbi:MAG: hypothetical protein HFI81_10085 [Eubacterium sp.]|jgi:hypothetical protein|nr:hypothetical protein [Eubacterium sp.]
MLKKTISYEDFDGNQRTEDHYFNLTEAEITEMELSMNGGLSQLLTKILQENDQKQIIEYFKKIVLMAYGEKSLDGRKFVKNQKIRDEFASTAAYSEIFMELATDADAASAFVKGVMPKNAGRMPAALKAPADR